MSAYWPARLYPLSARLARGRPGADRAAARTLRECEAEIVDIAPVVADPDILDRVTGMAPFSTVEEATGYLSGRRMQLHALDRHVFRDVLATPQGFFTAGAGFNQPRGYPPPDLLRSPGRAERGFYALSANAFPYFGHWVFEALAAACLEPEDSLPFLPPDPAWNHAPGYLALSGVRTPGRRFVHFDEMGFCDARLPTRKALDAFAELHRRLSRDRPVSGARGLYLSRGGTGQARALLGEEALMTALQARGFEIAATSDALDDIRTAGGGVPLTVSVEGSHMMHGLLAAATGARHLILVPSDRFSLVYAYYAHALGGRVGAVLVTPEAGGYRVDLDATLRALDALEAAP